LSQVKKIIYREELQEPVRLEQELQEHQELVPAQVQEPVLAQEQELLPGQEQEQEPPPSSGNQQ